MRAFIVCDYTNPDGPDGEVGFDPQEKHLIFNGEPISIKELEKNANMIQGKASYCRQEMAIEAQMYQRLGAHPRLVQFKYWDPVDHTLRLEYMPHGNLREYVEKHGQKMSPAQRQQWIMEAAEGVELLHSHGVIQGDVGPHNFLLDVNLGLKSVTSVGLP